MNGRSRGWDREAEWRQMLARSFSPTEWFVRDERPEINERVVEGISMWIYRAAGEKWEVGFFTPDKLWVQESIYTTKEEAARRVHFLNGGHGMLSGEVKAAAERGYSGT